MWKIQKLFFLHRLIIHLILIYLWSCSSPENIEIEGNSDNKKLLEREIERIQSSIYENPSEWRGYLGIGWAQLDQKKYRYAIKNFNMALKINSEATSAYMGLGMAYENLGNTRYAIDSYLRVIDMRPDWMLAHYQLGRIYQLNGKEHDAEKVLNFLIKKDKYLADKLLDKIY